MLFSKCDSTDLIPSVAHGLHVQQLGPPIELHLHQVGPEAADDKEQDTENTKEGEGHHSCFISIDLVDKMIKEQVKYTMPDLEALIVRLI